MSERRLSLRRPPDDMGCQGGELEFPWGSPLPPQMPHLDGSQEATHPEHLTTDNGLTGCLACGHPELFREKDFPRGLGILIVVVAAVLAPFTSYISLGVAALLDALLYRFASEMHVCYVCETQHRGFSHDPRHPRFDIEISERLKFGDRAVMGKPMRPEGTAGAPEPEH